VLPEFLTAAVFDGIDGGLAALAVLALVLLLVLGLVAARRRGRPMPPGRPSDGPTTPSVEVQPVEEAEDAAGEAQDAAAPDVGPAPREKEAAAAPPDDAAAVDIPAPVSPPTEPELALPERFRRRLTRTRNVLGGSVAGLFGRGLSDEAWEGLEEALITADVGVVATTEIVEELRRRTRDEGVTTPAGVLDLLKQELRAALFAADRTLARSEGAEPTVWLVTGVNGTGKTTTVGKLAAVERRAGRTVVLAAADTFRAAAAEQLGIWAERTGAALVRKDEGADPASVAYEAHDVASSQQVDVLMVDTAGRLHNKRQLMEELGKVKRVLEKRGPVHETLLVLDATTGQNGIAQARAFLAAVAVTGIALTKLDGSSKGGIVVAVQRELGLPVKLVGLGEEVDDLAVFDPELFVEGLFPADEVS